MALTSTQRSLCNKLATDYDSLVAPVKAAKVVIKKTANDLDTYLRGMVFSDTGVINNAIAGFQDDANDALPGDDLEAMNDLQRFIDNCPYMSYFAPVSAVIGATNGVFDAVDGFINQQVDLGIPEFGAGFLANKINDLLSGAGIPGGDVLAELLNKADKLLNCLSTEALCGDSYGARIAEIEADLNGLYDDLNLIGGTGPNKGKFDYETLYSDIGMSPSEIANVNAVINSIDLQKELSSTAINDSIAAVQNLTKQAGGFF